jgi:hypothetical protein
MKTWQQTIAEGERLQTLNALRSMPKGVPFGFTQTAWHEMTRKMIDRARAAGVTEKELADLGFPSHP